MAAGDILLKAMAISDNQPDQLFYDGTCGLCHRAVIFAMNHDPRGTLFRFAPLQGDTFQALIDAERRAQIPDSLVILTASNELLIRSDATIRTLRRIGGAWAALGDLTVVIPRPLRDAVYNFVARVRYRFFGRKTDLCPVMTPDQRRRFDP
jgi:predicted DCC family thiol-disulfide oxidoreductase YuxK